MDNPTRDNDLDRLDDLDDQTVEGVALDTAPSPVQDRTRAYLIVVAGAQVGQMVRVDQPLVLGRASTAALRVSDPSVSKNHARLVPSDSGEILLEDLESHNGTWVNGHRVGQAKLSDGDKIYLGETTILKFSLADSLDEAFQKHMYQAALHDPLTGLFNRRHLMEQLKVEAHLAQRNGLPVSFILLDIDCFKQVNDTYGHSVGDEVLSELAAIMHRSTRREDFAARYGGEEFAIVCRGVPTDTAYIIAERFRQFIEAARLVAKDPQRVVTVSAGVAGMPSPGIGDTSAMVEAADRALYRAKQTGRNRVCQHEAADDSPKTGGGSTAGGGTAGGSTAGSTEDGQ